MTRYKLAMLFSLKVIFLACVFTPVTAPSLGMGVANAQFQIIIPGFGYRGYRRGYRHRYRSSRRSRGGNPGGEAQQTTGTGKVGVGSSRGGKD